MPIEPAADPHLDALLAEAGWVLTLAKRLARDQAAAEDIAQGALVLALERRPSVEGGLRPWLARVVGRLARRRVRSELRRQDREVEAAPSLGAAEAGADEVLERFEIQQDLARRVRALPEPYRGVLIRRYYEGLSVKEIARASGATPGTVRSQIARGLERVRAQYDPGPEDRSALGVFLIAAGSGTGILSRRAAEIAVMQTSTKIAVAAAVALAATVAVLGFDSGRGGNLEVEGVEVPVARMELAPVKSGLTPVVEVPQEESTRVAAGVVASVAPAGSAIASGAEDVASAISTVRARIVGEDLRPLVGATLSSVHPDGRARGANNVAYSDYDGRVVLELADDSVRRWRDQVFDMAFAVGADDHGTAFVIKQPRLHGVTDLGEVRLGPGGVVVGYCVDEQGLPIEGAVLQASAGATLEDQDASRITGPRLDMARPHAVSALDGSFELAGLGAGLAVDGNASVRVWAHAAGRLWTITDPIAIALRGRVDVGRVVLDEIPPEIGIQGSVVRPDGRPAAGARVDFLAKGAPFEGHAMTDSYGRFIIVTRDDGAIDIAACDTARRFGRSATVAAERGEWAELRLVERSVLAVTAVDMEGAPMEDVHIRPVQVGSPPSSLGDGGLVPGEDWQYTDADGRVEIEAPGGSFALWARKTGSGSETVGPFEHGTAPQAVTITMPQGRTLSGQVLAYGKPVAGAKVWAMGRYEDFVAMTGGFPNRYPSGAAHVTTDSEGRFSAPLKRDWLAIGVVARLDGLATGETSLVVPSGEGARDVEVHMTVGGAIEGAVIPPPGMQAAGLYVAASRGDGFPMSTLVDAAGRYRFEGLTPGNWRVEGRLREARTELLSISRHPDDILPRWNAHVADSETFELDVDMRDLGDVELRGQLRIDDGAPLPGWTVEVVRPRHDRGPTATPAIALDSDGRFAFTTRPGRVDLRLVGRLTGGATVEVLREMRLQGPEFEWEETLFTAAAVELVDGDPKQVRFVRGIADEGDRELTIVSVDEYGFVRAEVPVGRSSLQAPAQSPEEREAWVPVRTVEVR